MLDLVTAGKGTQAVKEAIWEINGHRKSNYAEVIADISASVRGIKVIENEKIGVCLEFDGTNYSIIGILWDDYGHADYKEMGLYGEMKTQFNIVKKKADRTLIVQDQFYEIEIKY